MSQRPTPAEPIRNRDGVIVYTSLQERPQPNYRLSGAYRMLLVVSVMIAIIAPLYFLFQVAVTEVALLDTTTGEALAMLAMMSATTIGAAVLSRFPRIYNYPFMLTEHNAQRQYRNAAHMMIWLTFSVALVVAVMVLNWLWRIPHVMVWIPLALMIGTMTFFIWRMVTLR